MKFIILMAFISVGCGSEVTTNKGIDVDSETEKQDEPSTIFMCQQGYNRAIEFEMDQYLMHWQACYDFRPCIQDDNGNWYESKNIWSEQQIQEYRINHC